jgi:hypothetical protein
MAMHYVILVSNIYRMVANLVSFYASTYCCWMMSVEAAEL